VLRLAISPEELIPLFGMAVGVIFIIAAAVSVVQIAQSQIGHAIARRIRGGELDGSESHTTLNELREQVAGLEQRLAESEERLDFAERLLAQQRPPEALPGGARTDQH
jgi:hypothetical protein